MKENFGLFYYVPFPDCQDYEEKYGFEDNAVLAEDGGYFIDKDWLELVSES